MRGGAARAAHAVVVETNGGLQTDATYRPIPLCSEAFTCRYYYCKCIASLLAFISRFLVCAWHLRSSKVRGSAPIRKVGGAGHDPLCSPSPTPLPYMCVMQRVVRSFIYLASYHYVCTIALIFVIWTISVILTHIQTPMAKGVQIVEVSLYLICYCNVRTLSN